MMTCDFSPFAMTVPEILLPSPRLDLKVWGVVACDQYTQEPRYWERAEAEREGWPSTLSLILPEAFLSQKDRRLPLIHQAMRDYLDSGVFLPPRSGMVYVERKTEFGRLRRGLVTAIDLEAYDWDPQKKAPIRATEATILERIPARMDIRRGAALECPHILLLANDPEGRLVEGAARFVRERQIAPAYSTDLMFGAGHLAGYVLAGDEALESIRESLGALASSAGNAAGSQGGFLFAVGDGNHSLASAKALWDEYKAAHPQEADHPARYALAEIVNIYDEGLTFEPIHRAVFNADPSHLASFAADKLGGKLIAGVPKQACIEKVEHSERAFCFGWKKGSGCEFALLEAPGAGLAVSALQGVLDGYLASHRDASIDYIHGTDSLFRLALQDRTTSILLPPIAKGSFFSTLNAEGVLPRKSFSLGEASEKRFYFECRKLF
ncbi:MAG: DUF1015 domain-containing protein [Spirochaetaceae bacterium]|jgi:hypothetical protein|nr:DUF1015 domain-containing protein [Spirochaetaceae bacterium]